jgi:arginase family enzyme
MFDVAQGPEDLSDDVTAGFDLIHTYDLDDLGLGGITRKIKQRVGNGPVYISLDIDVADPSAAPASESSTCVLVRTWLLKGLKTEC